MSSPGVMNVVMRKNTFPIVVFCAVLVIYLGIVGNFNWIFWTALGLILAERLFLQAKFLVAKLIMRSVEKQMMEQLQAMAGQSPLFGNEDEPPIK